MPNFIKIAMNLGFIIKGLKLLAAVIGEMVKGKKLPDCARSVEVFDFIEEFLARGIFDIPGVDEKMIAEWLDKLEKELLVCKSS